MDAPHSPLVSVIVTTKNEERNIENCLRGIASQAYSNIETIVVDNFSTDKTKDIARKYTDKVFDKGPERSAQRNYGIGEISKGEYVLFLDADMIAAPKLIESCVSEIQKNNCLALYIPEIVLGAGFWSRVRRFERGFYDGTSIDVVRFFKKEAFSQVGGFDEQMSGPEDWDFDKKIRQAGKVEVLGCARSPSPGQSPSWPLENFIRERGANPAYNPAVIYHNEADFNLSSYLRKKGYYAQGFAASISKWGKRRSRYQKAVWFLVTLLWRFYRTWKVEKSVAASDVDHGHVFPARHGRRGVCFENVLSQVSDAGGSEPIMKVVLDFKYRGFFY